MPDRQPEALFALLDILQELRRDLDADVVGSFETDISLLPVNIQTRTREVSPIGATPSNQHRVLNMDDDEDDPDDSPHCQHPAFWEEPR